jgi:hypothetical protein
MAGQAHPQCHACLLAHLQYRSRHHPESRGARYLALLTLTLQLPQQQLLPRQMGVLSRPLNQLQLHHLLQQRRSLQQLRMCGGALTAPRGCVRWFLRLPRRHRP